jgi:hypothetical protein
VRHIEHFANKEDFLANIGVLNFTSSQAQPYADGYAFAGAVFARNGKGHMLNQHYLGAMFKIVDGMVNDEGNEFMNPAVVNSR